MNHQVLDQARAAYRAGDFSTAAQMFAAVKNPGELCGEADHLRGNSLMRLGLARDAAAAYADALRDTAYGHTGALLTNQGKAYVAAGDLARAQRSFSEAVRDASYATPFKAYMGLGQVLLKNGNPTDAGVAFRQAAIDGANPAPAAALCELGACFVLLSRPGDAIEAYQTALDFAGDRDDTRAINAGLGQALAASNRPEDAVDAFTKATADGIYRLTPEQQQAFTNAREALSAQQALAPSSTASTPAQAAAKEPVDPLDPLGKSGSFMPDPSDTGFFTLSESDMIKQDKKEMKIRRKHRHTGLKVFLVILVIVLVVGGGLGFAYTRGIGYPSQQDTLTNLFQAVSDGKDANAYLAGNLDDAAKSAITASIPEKATPSITGLDSSMTESKATVNVQLSKGGTQTYEVDFTRDGLGWKVSNLTVDLSGTDASADASSGDASATGSGAGSGDTVGDASASGSGDAASSDASAGADASTSGATAQQ